MSRRHATVPDPRRRRCLITGAASGIGRATAVAAAARGAVVLRRLNDRFTAVARASAAKAP